MATNREKNLGDANSAIDRIHTQIRAIDLLCQGTLLKRTKVCGKPNCRCAQDPSARHGPYHEWNRRLEGRLVHSLVSAEQARLLHRAIRNYRVVLRLLARWSRETAKIIGVKNELK